MAVLTQVKKDMEFYKSLSSLLKVLKGVAVSQFHILERKIKTFDRFSLTVEGFLRGIDTSSVAHPFITPRAEAQAIVAVTSDSGLLGGLNLQVMKLAFEELKSKKDILMVVGERGKIYARDEKLPFKGFPGITDETRFDLALTLRDYALRKVVDNELGVIKVIYPRALSLIIQRIERFSPLPYGDFEKDKRYPLINLDEFIQESSLGDCVEYLVYFWLGQKLYDLLGQARLAELAARFIHLEESSQRLEDLDKQLKMKYFRLKHEITDRSMRELFASRLNRSAR
ncbi:MAG: F0F1 ATP synthase subunit gamma [Candidatus Omnitrophica bacterium]|nr:F0F1 ATP synthase subunit gamma [Candidatus Omnitrophota bacterium]